jgi:hypothetical protein
MLRHLKVNTEETHLTCNGHPPSSDGMTSRRLKLLSTSLADTLFDVLEFRETGLFTKRIT